jgi:putative colanic acid biosynthesis acetyltransferase WcaF
MIKVKANLVNEGKNNPSKEFFFDPIQTRELSVNIKILSVVWAIVNQTLFRIPFFGMRSVRRYLLILFGAKLADRVSIHRSVKVEYPWNLEMGQESSLGEGCWIYALEKVIIGKSTCISKNVSIITGSHDTKSLKFSLIKKPVLIGDGCWLAYSAIILPGVKIGNFSVIAAGSVVFSDIGEAVICAGNQSHQLGDRFFRQ